MLRRTTRRRTAVVAAAVVVVAGLFAAFASQARSAPKLPSIGPQALLASTIGALEKAPPISGTVGVHADLGIPSLPSDGPGSPTGAAALLSSLSGDNTLRVWSSQSGFKVAQVLPAAERSITVSRTNAWAWDSQKYTAWHMGPLSGTNQMPPSMPDPTTLAQQALDAITPTTSVTVAEPAWVAGQASYVLVLTPESSGTLVGHVDLSIDARNRLPLGVSIYARGAGSPAVSSAFTQVSFAPLPASTFEFTPPPGAKVVNVPPPSGTSSQSTSSGTHRGQASQNVRVFGQGWTTVIALRVPAQALSSNTLGVSPSMLFPMQGPLFSADLVTRGDHAWVVAGMVPRSTLAGVEPKLP